MKEVNVLSYLQFVDALQENKIFLDVIFLDGYMPLKKIPTAKALHTLLLMRT